jgi:transposase
MLLQHCRRDRNMYAGRLVYSQLIDHLPMHTFRRCVQRYRGNHKVKSFTCLDQYLCMAFAQLTYRESLRDIEACLRSQYNKLYHMGIRGKVSRNTLANANKIRDWRIYADFAQSLISVARQLYIDDDFGVELDQTVYALDSTTIDLSLSVFPWARFRQTKAAIKLHTLLDLRGNIPTFIHISDGKLHDVNVLDELIPEPASFYVMDRGYLDFARLYTISQCAAFFVIRAKSNFQFRRIYSHPIDKDTGLKCDQTIALTGPHTSKDYPEKLRRIKYYDAETNKTLVFLTNSFTLSALTIAQLYRCRWQVELFFKWIKQNLRIKSFYGTTDNAVKAQIWIAVSVYVLVAIIKKRLRLDMSLYTILQILSVNAFERTWLLQILTDEHYKTQTAEYHKQLTLFN